MFFLILTLKSSAIKANSVHRRLGLEIMYSKGCLATGCDAGKAFLHKAESNGGAPVCNVHSMQEVGPATTTKVNTYRRKTMCVLQVYKKHILVYQLHCTISNI